MCKHHSLLALSSLHLCADVRMFQTKRRVAFRASSEDQVDGAPALYTAGFPVCLPAEVTAQGRFGEAPGCGPLVVQSSGLSTGLQLSGLDGCCPWFGWVYSLLDKELAEWPSAGSGGEWS